MIEVQFQPDETLYRRLLVEITLYLHRAAKLRDWRALVIYPDLRHERIPIGYRNLVNLPEIQRVDLSGITGQDSPTPGWDLLRLILDETGPALTRAKRLMQTASTRSDRLDLCNFIETILVYKLPRSTREEIQVMLGITDIDLKQTRFYQDVLAEGRQ